MPSSYRAIRATRTIHAIAPSSYKSTPRKPQLHSIVRSTPSPSIRDSAFRGLLKQPLVAVGYPAQDASRAGYITGDALP